jgi:competence transcription factor ComK
MSPLFIEGNPGQYVNARNANEIFDTGNNTCSVYFTNDQYQKLPYSAAEFIARVNNALALMQAVERMAK